jgi:hypothetical protein
MTSRINSRILAIKTSRATLKIVNNQKRWFDMLEIIHYEVME